MSRNKGSRWALALAVLGALAGARAAVAAQEATTGTIAGQVIDAQGLAIPGATVTVTGARGTKTAVTNAEGGFLVPFVVPGAYTVRVELQGFRPASVENVAVQLGQRTVIPSVTLRVGALTEQVEVVAAAPAVDLATTATGATLDSAFLASVPVQRHVSDVVYLAPGVIGSGDVGRANPSISGASGLENQYIIDGVNVSNPGYGGIGSYSIEFGSLGTGVPFDFINEVQVKTAGYEAEFGQATGGIVQAVTKSGGNTFAGSGFVYWQPEQLQGDFRQTVLPNLTWADESVNNTATMFSDVGATFSGPLWRDRMFFFGAIDRQWNDTTMIAPIGVPLRAELGEVTRERFATAYSGKFTWQMNAIHQLDFSVFGDPSSGDMGPQRRDALTRTDTAAFSSIDFGGHNQALRYEGVLGSNWLLTGSVAHASNSIEEQPLVDAPSVQDATGPTIVLRGGVGFYEVGNDGSNTQYQAKTTYLWRNHEFRGGLVFEDINYDNIIDRTGPPIVLPNGERTVTGAQITILPDPVFGQIYRVTRANTSNVRQTRQDYFAFFLQDTWTIGDRVTFKPGLRYEQQRLVGNLEDFQWDGNWAPRLGITWDPTGTGRSKVYANYGRYFAKIPNDLAARALSADAGVTRADYFDEALTRPVPEGVLAAEQTQHFLQAGLHASEFDPDSKSTYSDEYLAGAEYEILPDFSVGINYTHRNFGRVLEDVGTVPLTAYFLFDEAGNSVEYFITNPDANTRVEFPSLGASFEEAIHDYDAVTFTAQKRFGDRWGLQSSYRWARLWGTFEGFFRNDNGQSDPAITSLFDFPTNDPSYSQIGVPQFAFRGDIRYLGELGAGPLPTDRTHQFKVYGNYLTPVGINLGLGLTSYSGTPLTALAANPYYDSDGEIPETPRGEGFETVDDFRDRTPWYASVDVHADYRLPIMTNRSLAITADVFNLFNRRTAQDYDNYTEASFQVPNPDFGRVIEFQDPITARFGLRFTF
jgi:outer membrane receptor protein involved in Fe transport